MTDLKIWIASIFIAGILLFGMIKFVGWVVEQDRQLTERNRQAAEYIIKCIEGGKNAEDCRTLGRLKFLGGW